MTLAGRCLREQKNVQLLQCDCCGIAERLQSRDHTISEGGRRSDIADRRHLND